MPQKTFNLWYPRAGRTQQAQQAAGSAVVFNLAGTSGQDYILPAGVTQAANALFGAGSGAGNATIASLAANPNLLSEGWPLMENSVSFTDVNSQALLDQITLAYLNQVQLPVAQPQVFYNPGSDSDQPLGTFAIGDDARLIIDPDDFFPNGYDSSGGEIGEQWWRVIQTQVSVNEEGKSQMLVIFGTPPVFPGE